MMDGLAALQTTVNVCYVALYLGISASQAALSFEYYRYALWKTA